MFQDGDGITSDYVFDPTPSVEQRLLDEAKNRELADAIASLAPRERSILEQRLAGKTLQEIGEKISGGRSRERVRQIESDAIRKIRRHLHRED